jgi:glycosyltransferase involved in cell wall biosynthesis
MGRILVVTKEVPLPIQATGTSLRLNPVLRHLAKDHVVDLAAVGDQRADADRWAEEAREFCGEVVCMDRANVGRLRRWGRTARALVDPSRPPWENVDPFSSEYLPVLENLLRANHYDVLLGVGNVMDVMCRLIRDRVLPKRVVVDWVDAPSLLYERKAPKTSGMTARFRRFRTQRLVDWQQFVNARVQAAIYIAEFDRRHAGEAGNSDVFVLGNGVLEVDRPLPDRPDTPPTIGFLGNMAYGPNVQAAMRLHDRVFTALARSMPELRLKIIGRDPPPEVSRLASDRVEVTGEVASIWPELRAVDVMVFPMEMGGGLQNKVLESAAAGCAVVVTPVGAAGTGPDGADTLIIEETDSGMVRAVETLLRDPDALDEARARARRLLDTFDWATILPRYAEIVLGP